MAVASDPGASKEFFECRTQKTEEKRNLKTLRNETVAAFPGRIIDPSLACKGWSKNFSHGRRRTGKTTGRWSGNAKTNKRECGGPIQRRDPTAQEKLYIIRCIFEKVAEAAVKEVSELSTAAKQLLEKRFAYPWERLTGWLKLKDVLDEFVFQQRCGLHGLRLFGSNKPTSYGSQSLGARLRPLRSPKPTKQQPLNGVLWKPRAWFQNERLHNHEVLHCM